MGEKNQRTIVKFLEDKAKVMEANKPLPEDGYKSEYCEKLIDFFDIPPYRTFTSPEGKISYIANDLPLFSSFAKSIRVTQLTLRKWAKNHPEFKEAMDIAKEMQEEILVTNSLRGTYTTAAAIFAQKNILGWSDKVKTESVAEFNINALMAQVEQNTKGKNFLED